MAWRSSGITVRGQGFGINDFFHDVMSGLTHLILFVVG